MMVLLSGAVRASKPAALRLQALEGWLLLVQALLHHAPAQLSGVMHQVQGALPKFCVFCVNGTADLLLCYE